MNGTSLSKSICNFDNPWPSTDCGRNRCLVCNSQNSNSNSKGVNCWKSGVTYRLTCNICTKNGLKAQYKGESSRSCFTRGSQHLRDLESRRLGTPLGDHAVSHHSGTTMGKDDITMTCTGVHPRPTQRLASEGLLIEKLIKEQKVQGSEKVIILNSKTNFHQPSLIAQHTSKLRLE